MVAQGAGGCLGAPSQLGIRVTLGGEIGAQEQRREELVIGTLVAASAGLIDHPRHVDGGHVGVARVRPVKPPGAEDARHDVHPSHGTRRGE